ncbi:MAG: DUF362 domain-containing protein [Acidobacteria bacterium]|nr:DUF362 domain-containing protein [Acidobacteriota bacterium]
MPLPRFQKPQIFNVILLLAAAVTCAVLLHVEGYWPRLRWFFIVYAVALVLWNGWVAAFAISKFRIVSLAVTAALAGYLTQVVGVSNGFWSYPATFYFVPFMFVLASLGMYGLCRYPFTHLFRGLGGLKSRWLNLLVVFILLVGFVFGLSHSPQEPSLLFRVYYLFLALFALYASQLLSFRSFTAVILAGWGIGYISEALGAASNLWTFTASRSSPPFFLVFSSWPLEFFLHYGLSAIVAGETLDTTGDFAAEERLYQLQRQHPMYTGAERQVVVASKNDDKFQALETVLTQSGFWPLLERRLQQSGKTKERFAIVLKPNFMFMYSKNDRSTYTDPQLVEHLVCRLQSQGYTNITIVEAQSAYGNYFENRDVLTVAHYIGYSEERGYHIVDLTREMVPYTYAGGLGEHYASPTWMNADFRISFAKNKTHTWAFYTLTLKNIYGALPMQDKLKEYHTKREIYYVTIDFLLEFPVHFGLIDAYWSADGPFGIFADREPNLTKTVIGGRNLVAVDWVGARKMGLDPMVSRYMQLAVQAFGRPEIELIGDTSVYPNWTNVDRDIIEFVDAMEENYEFSSFLFSVLNEMDHFFTRKKRSSFIRLARVFTAPLRMLFFVQARRSALSAPRRPARSRHHGD